MTTILNPTSRTQIASNQLMGQLEAQQNKKAEAETAAVSSKYQARLNNELRLQDQWRDVKADTGKATTALSGTVGKLKTLLNRIESQISAINRINLDVAAGKTVNTDIYANGFDAAIRGMDSVARNSGNPKLLSDDNAKLEYEININGQTAEVQGVSVTSDYYILDSNGDRWQLDRQAGNLKRYTDYPDGGTSDVAYLRGGIQLDSLSGTDITFTINPDSADPKQFSGTIKSSGAGLKDSWFYGNLASDANRTSALEDLRSAKVGLELELSRYEAAKTISSFYETRANEEIQGRQETINDTQLARVAEIQELQAKLSREFQATSNSVALGFAAKNQYQALFSSFNSGFVNALINVYA
ncbi:MAG: hypothetical protein ACPGOV_10400 [Magnetovibrionaceae bacterium]